MKALIFGITGQDGSYLAEFLLSQTYQVIGVISTKNDIGRQNIGAIEKHVEFVEGDLLDQQSIEKTVTQYRPDEIYNLAGITFIPMAWGKPALTYDVNTIGTMRILQSIRNLSPKSKFFQASSAKMYGKPDAETVDETTAFNPIDPYAVSKYAAHESVRLFREHFGVFGSCGILFNHESNRRGAEFVTKKITLGAVKIKLGLESKLALGNLDSQEDWGWAPDYVKGMWLMLQQAKPDDYILATGKLHSVRDICQIAFGHLKLNYQDYVTLDDKFYRPIKGKAFCGNPQKAEKYLGWKREVDFEKMIELMVDYDYQKLSK